MVTEKSKQPTTNGEIAPQVLTRGEREAAKRARKLRRQTSGDEQKLWHQLRDKQLDGFRFRRQRSIGKYIVDFVCDDANLIVELRDKLPEKNLAEKARAAFFKALGYRVVHMLNSEVAANIKTGLALIRKNLQLDAPAKAPKPDDKATKKPKKAAAKKPVAKKKAGELGI